MFFSKNAIPSASALAASAWQSALAVASATPKALIFHVILKNTAEKSDGLFRLSIHQKATLFCANLSRSRLAD
jgi:hypothetical protein